MDYTIKSTVEKLKTLIDKNGPAYLSDKPYLTYKELVASDLIDEKIAGAIMLALVMGIDRGVMNHDAPEEVSKMIQKECCFNKKMADRLSLIFFALYSQDNEAEWKARKLNGWKQFLKADFYYTWKGFSVWQTSGGSVDCYFEAKIVLKPAESIKKDEELSHALNNNPFMSREEITEYYKQKVRDYLDDEFEEYCTCEDYYQPVVEDFEIDIRVSEWCDRTGFEVVSCKGDGDDGGFEPSFRNGRY